MTYRFISKKPVKRTETSILNEMSEYDNSLTDIHSLALIRKMNKGQKNAYARSIARKTEAESELLVSSLPSEIQKSVRSSIKDYVPSSSAIQNSSRNNPGSPGRAVENLDYALDTIRQKIIDNSSNSLQVDFLWSS